MKTIYLCTLNRKQRSKVEWCDYEYILIHEDIVVCIFYGCKYAKQYKLEEV